MKQNQAILMGVLALAALTVIWIVLSGDGSPLTTLDGNSPESVEPSGELADQRALQPAGNVALSPEGQKEGRVVIDERQGEIPVQVLDQATGLPLEGVPLRLKRSGAASPTKGLSDGNGRFAFSGLTAGDYSLGTQARGGLDYKAEPLALTVADGMLEEIELRVERRWFLGGIVVEAGSQIPVPGASLMMGTPSGRRSFLGTADGGGRFRSKKSYAAGPAILFLSQNETKGLMRAMGDGPELLEVMVGKDDVSQLVVELEWIGALNGVVVDPQDNPIADAEVRVLTSDSIYLLSARLRFWALYGDRDDGGRMVRTDERGRFSLERLPNDRNLTLLAYATGFASGKSQDLSPPFRKGDAPVELRLDIGGSIVGKVFDENGQPIKGARVSALSKDTDFQPDPDRTDEKGSFVLSGLKPGFAEVTATRTLAGGQSHPIASGQISVLAGTEVELILHAGSDGVHISGVAVDQDGVAITKDRMQLRLRATPLQPIAGEQSWGTDSPLQPDGTFNVTVPREGEYRLTLLGSTIGERWESKTVQAPAQDVRLLYAIVPTSQLTVRTLDAASGQQLNKGNLSISWDRGSIGANFFGGEHTSRVREGLYTVTVDVEGYAPLVRKLDLRQLQETETLLEMQLDRGQTLSGTVVDSQGGLVKGSTIVLRVGGMLQTNHLVYSGADGHFTIQSAPIRGGSVCVIDEGYRILAEAEIGAGDVVLTIKGDGPK